MATSGASRASTVVAMERAGRSGGESSNPAGQRQVDLVQMCRHAVGRANCNRRATSRRRSFAHSAPPDRRDREVERRRRMPEATIFNLCTEV